MWHSSSFWHRAPKPLKFPKRTEKSMCILLCYFCYVTFGKQLWMGLVARTINYKVSASNLQPLGRGQGLEIEFNFQ